MSMDLLKAVANLLKSPAPAQIIKQTTLEQQAPVVNQPSTMSPTVSVSSDSSTVAQTSSESEENIFTDTSSLTVIMSKDYRGENTESWTNTYSLKGKEDVSMDDIVKRAYGNEAVSLMTEGEKNSAMWSIIDNNRWMIDNINETYTVHQIASLVQDEAQDASEEDIAAMTEYLFEYRENAIKQAKAESEDEKDIKLESTQEDLEAKNAAKQSALEEKKSILLKNMDGVKLSQLESKVLNNEFKKFDINFSRTDQILPELIKSTDFTTPINLEAGEVTEVFIPDIRTLRKDNSMVDEQMTETIDFNAKQPQLVVTKEMYDGWVASGEKDAVSKNLQLLIAENYGLVEEGDTDYNLANSYAGMGILAALGKEEGNNAIFKGKDEDLTKHLDSIIANMETTLENGDFTLYCPNTEVNAMHDGRLDDTDVRAQLVQDTNKTQQIQYLHVNSSSISLENSVRYINEDGEEVAKGEGTPTLTGMDILAHVDYEKTTLADALTTDVEAGDDDKIATAYSALMQIASNNPSMLKAIEEAEAEFDNATSSYVDKGFMTQEEYNMVKMLNTIQNINFAQAATDYDADESNSVKQGDEIVLENIQYIIPAGTTKAVRRTASSAPKEEAPTPTEDEEETPTATTTPPVSTTTPPVSTTTPPISTTTPPVSTTTPPVSTTTPPVSTTTPPVVTTCPPPVDAEQTEDSVPTPDVSIPENPGNDSNDDDINCGEVDSEQTDDKIYEEPIIENKNNNQAIVEGEDKVDCGQVASGQTGDKIGGDPDIAPSNPVVTESHQQASSQTTTTTTTSTESASTSSSATVSSTGDSSTSGNGGGDGGSGNGSGNGSGGNGNGDGGGDGGSGNGSDNGSGNGGGGGNGTVEVTADPVDQGVAIE